MVIPAFLWFRSLKLQVAGGKYLLYDSDVTLKVKIGTVIYSPWLNSGKVCNG
jgi:hypothetical protein